MQMQNNHVYRNSKEGILDKEFSSKIILSPLLLVYKLKLRSVHGFLPVLGIREGSSFS